MASPTQSGEFAPAHVPGSVHIALTGQYASWATRILGLDTKLIIVGEDPDHVRESQLRLARVGMESVTGYLEDGVAGWVRSGKSLDSLPQIAAKDLADLLRHERERVAVLDVRKPAEVESGTGSNKSSPPGRKCMVRRATARRKLEREIVCFRRSPASFHDLYCVYCVRLSEPS